ncbi:MAG: hypothetical protein RL367_2165 [Pseudomonadota bacterium]
MASFRQPTFQERTEAAAKAKQAALDKLRAKPPVDEAVLAARREKEDLRQAALLKAREEKLAARALEKEQKKARAEEQALIASTKAPALSSDEQKAIRDAKYAARKKRIGKR